MLNSLQIFSLLSGIILSYIISKLIRKYNTVYKAPNSKKIKEQIYQHDNKYYRFVPQPVIGPISISREYADAYAHV